MPTIPEPIATDIDIRATLAGGPGGQNVNKRATAAHLRYDLHAATLPEPVKSRLLSWRDQRIGADGVIVIKARQFRSFERNRTAAINRLRKMIAAAATPPKPRKRTRPSHAARKRRLDAKARRAKLKNLRSRDPRDD